MLCELWVPAFVKQEWAPLTTPLLYSVAIAVINSPPLRDIESLWRTTGDVYWGKESEVGSIGAELPYLSYVCLFPNVGHYPA